MNTPSSTYHLAQLLPSFNGTLLSLPMSICASQRSIWDIIWSCFATIFACCWLSVHPNIPPADASRVSVAIGRLKLMFWSIVCPELVIFWAMKQWIGARNLVKLRRDQGWTKTHGYFLQMGGFVLYQGNLRVRVLDPEPFGWGRYDGKIVMPTISEKEINDRSKADGLSKGLVICQVTWFVLQCFARIAEGLDVTQLELVTLAFAALNGIMYFLWWNKPLDVQSIEKVFYLSEKLESSVQTESADVIRIQNKNTIGPPESQTTGGKATERNQFSRAHPREKIIIPANGLTLDGRVLVDGHTELIAITNTKSTCTILSNIFRTTGILLNKVIDLPMTLGMTMRGIADTYKLRQPNDLHVPPFYANDFIRPEIYPEHHFSIIPIIGIIFGGIHCAGWNFFFPSYTESLIWRSSSVIIMVFPLPILFIIIAVSLFDRGRKLLVPRDAQYTVNRNPWVVKLLISLPVIYVLARFVLLFEALFSLRDLPSGAYDTIEWLSFLPHI